ncbi:transmembrane protein 138 [Toxorhynchites rutilus septentrionalis]|uniref:transmembrane protein 138 n=1 Tax=Toxorhynchites rutilus septentrionalis TaxID=329112 RepID=UPI00247AA96C|nr:transmembrane protein 138 [Toxorhynchites rutilus septentrionalis]
MFKLSLKRFASLLFFQIIFLCVDLGINSFSYLARGDKVSIIFLFLTQDVCLILSFTAINFSLYMTYVYQAGMAHLLYTKLRVPLLVSMLYFLLCISLHIWQVVDHHKSPYLFQWPKALTALFIIQRLFSPLYYYFYKRSALKMCDPRFYENLDWITSQLAIK